MNRKPLFIKDMMDAGSVKDISELNSILQRRCAGDVNEFWIYEEVKSGPCFQVLINGPIATLIFYDKTDSAMYVPKCIDNGLDPMQDSLFFINTPTEEHYVPNYQVLPASDALQAAKQFALSLSLPDGIEWLKL